jgi:hypothetical protein
MRFRLEQSMCALFMKFNLEGHVPERLQNPKINVFLVFPIHPNSSQFIPIPSQFHPTHPHPNRRPNHPNPTVPAPSLTIHGARNLLLRE